MTPKHIQRLANIHENKLLKHNGLPDKWPKHWPSDAYIEGYLACMKDYEDEDFMSKLITDRMRELKKQCMH